MSTKVIKYNLPNKPERNPPAPERTATIYEPAKGKRKKPLWVRILKVLFLPVILIFKLLWYILKYIFSLFGKALAAFFKEAGKWFARILIIGFLVSYFLNGLSINDTIKAIQSFILKIIEVL